MKSSVLDKYTMVWEGRSKELVFKDIKMREILCVMIIERVMKKAFYTTRC